MINSKTTRLLILVVAVPVAVAVLLYRLAEFDPAPLLEHVLSRSMPILPLKRYDRFLESTLHTTLRRDLYTRVAAIDGWIKLLHVADPADDKEKVKVENRAFTGGRPLGLAFGPDKQLIVAEAYKGP
ncbi:hypothetical protein NE237_024086 [Protea cynaroides]|uniref:Uncharacterized protein n=1 Tax=Protea cynaroides TaxID=273540 RepID=A0A9Q0HCZ9_9MAGN|nr:hypothetical protein NE237_024086 [Protea cynaroides]